MKKEFLISPFSGIPVLNLRFRTENVVVGEKRYLSEIRLRRDVKYKNPSSRWVTYCHWNVEFLGEMVEEPRIVSVTFSRE